MKFLSLYKQYKNIFAKPKIKLFIGKWKNEHNLPVWRKGNTIHLAKYNERINSYDYAKLISSQWTPIGKKNHPVISKFLKPTYVLPIWLSLYLFDNDVSYKTKYYDDDFNYEFPPHITLVLFGFAFSLTAYPPHNIDPDDYWTSILSYQYHNGNLSQINKSMGYYTDVNGNFLRFAFNPLSLKNKSQQLQLINIQNNNYETI